MSVLCIGGDKRMVYAAEYLGAKRLFMGDFSEPCEKFGAIVLPLPLKKDAAGIPAPLEKTSLSFDIILQYANKGAKIFAGGSPTLLEKFCRENGFSLYDYFASEALTLKNAALTAEAAAVILSQNGEGSVLGSKTLITGYGRIAKFLARYLNNMGGEIIIAARDPAQRAAAELSGFLAIEINNLDGEFAKGLDNVANTVPAHIFPEGFLEKFGGAYIELATLDGEREKQLCKKSAAKYIPAGGLPGKYFPKTAGKFIAEEIEISMK